MAMAALLTAGLCANAAVDVTDVVAKQRYPWNGLVDITCKVSGINASNGYRFIVVAVDKNSGKEYTASHFSVEQGGTGVSGWEVSKDGGYKLLWDARADLGEIVCERMAIRVTLEAGVSTGKVQLWEGGPYWADRNIGADNPWDYGLYFWWGDTTGHRPSGTTFSFNFYYDNSAIYTYGKSRAELQSAGWVTSNGVLAPAHDAAHVKWGGSWRMPTKQELSDLCDNCDWARTTMNGVNGYIVSGRGNYASNSIFLPCAGFGLGPSRNLAGSFGYYWSSVPYSDYYSSRAWGLLFGFGNPSTGDSLRSDGLPVRPVQGFTK